MRLPFAVALGAAALAVQVAAGAVEKYPSKPVRMVVPYAPGGGSDTIGRMVGLKLGEALGESFVIDNRPGAASMVATEIVAKSLPDGYTLILPDEPHTINGSPY